MNSKNALIIISAVILFLVISAPLKDTVVDDTYIHLQYARNLAVDNQLAFNKGEPSYGATSPLWVFLLSVGYKTGVDLLLLSHILSEVFAVLSIILIYYYVLMVERKRTAASAAAIIMSVEAWLVRWSSVGMETSLAVFMVLVVFILSLKTLRSIIYSSLFGLSLFFSALARPEIILLVPIAAVIFLFRKREKYSVRLTWLIVFVSAYFLWLIFIKNHTGTFFPLTAGAKRGWLFFSPANLKRVLLPLKIIAATLIIPSASLIIWVIFYWVKRTEALKEDMISNNLLFPLAWAAILPMAYVLLDFTILSRYLVPTAPAIIVLGVVSVSRLISYFACSLKFERLILGIFTIFVVLQNVIFYFLIVVPPTRNFTDDINDVLIPMGKWMRDNTAAEAVVATPDIGAIGYYSEREVLDLGGLVTPEINGMRDSLTVERIVSEGFFLEYDPDYLIDRNPSARRFSGKIIRGVEFIPLMSDTISTRGVRKSDPVVYTLYRLE
ncbi:MAG: hypothetical protein U5O15_03155 [Candidatus Krumholzibacteriota bacterium]|nr:hypothetical protein [Candidatus Krumholzibacteriota bacterium]